MLTLTADHIDLWITRADNVTHAGLLQQYQHLLTPTEQQAQQRFYFEKDRHRYLVTRVLLRTVLSQYAPIAPQDWGFHANAYGKPSITNDHPLAHHISFNVSHTDGLVLVGVTKSSALGVDVENLGRRAPLDAAAHYFSATEAAALAQLPAHLQADRFFQYWTLKESYVKARGMGLSIPLDQFSFDLSTQGQVSLSIDSRLHDSPTRWNLWQLRPTPEHLVAVCAERSLSDNQQIRLCEVVSPGLEQMDEPMLLEPVDSHASFPLNIKTRVSHDFCNRRSGVYR